MISPACGLTTSWNDALTVAAGHNSLQAPSSRAAAGFHAGFLVQHRFKEFPKYRITKTLAHSPHAGTIV